jgi:class 3 adenylate cyclase/streptogramin lyase
MAELPTGTVTFLFTDIEGSTRLLRELGRGYDTVLAEHQRIHRESFAAHEGREVDTQGDSFFVAFSRAGDAVAAAIEAQRAFARHAWPPGVKVSVRMGLHSGEPRPTGERYVGFGVHRAARVGAAGHGGQILLSNATRELVQDELPPDTALRDLGEFQLKDVERPERLYQVGADGLPSVFPPLTARQSGKARRLLRRKAVVALSAVLVVLVAVLSAAVIASRADSPPAVVPNSLVRIDTTTNEIADVFPVGRNPGDVAIVGPYVFVSSEEDATLTRIDVRSGDVTTSGTSGADSSLAAEGDSFVWAASLRRGRVTRLNAENLLEIEDVPLSSGLSLASVAVGAGSLWISQWSPSAILRYRRPTLRLDQRYDLGPAQIAAQLTYGEGAAWVALGTSNALLRIDARTGRTTEISVGEIPSDPTVGFDSVWVAAAGQETLWRVGALLEEVEATVRVGRVPYGVATGAGSVWVANNCDGTVSRVDPRTNEVEATIETGFFPKSLAVEDGHVWVGIAAAPFDPFNTGICD